MPLGTDITIFGCHVFLLEMSLFSLPRKGFRRLAQLKLLLLKMLPKTSNFNKDHRVNRFHRELFNIKE